MGIIEARFAVKRLSYEEIKAALPLVWEVFCEFEAPNCPDGAKQLFQDAVYDEAYLSALTAFGAYHEDKLIGILAMRENGSHVALFFVDGAYHNKGAGKALWHRMLSDNHSKRISVHSSLYAVPVYEKLGFRKTGGTVTEDGITFLPMVFER